MIPEFNEFGLLPEGVHRATREEFEQRFVRFDKSDRRHRLYESLQLLFDDASKADAVKRVIVAGSFVTKKAEPDDFDCLVVLDASVLDRELQPLEYNLASRSAARTKYGGDVLTVVAGTSSEARILEFFKTTRDGRRTGLLEVEL